VSSPRKSAVDRDWRLDDERIFELHLWAMLVIRIDNREIVVAARIMGLWRF
jgi:hypothetical protein